MSSAPDQVESEPPPVAAEVEAEADVPSSASPIPATSSIPAAAVTSPVSPATSTKSLKRTAEMMSDDEDRQDNKRKRLSGEPDAPEPSTSKTTTAPDVPDANKLVEDMGLELSCGCCSALCYNPVIVLPCQHYYCGSCYTLWTRQAGVNCPSCRSPVHSIIPSRAIQSLIDVYLRSVPSAARIAREKEQADEIYTAGQGIAVPTPRPRSPEIMATSLDIDNDAYYRPCPHCSPTNELNWHCPEPITEPSVDINRARLLTAGIPPGHAKCGSCDHLHATGAPTTSRCDFCHQSFCGLVVPTRCHAKRVNEARPIGMDNLMDILGNGDVYDAFGINAVEFDYMLDYLRERDINPRFIYAEIAEPLTASDDGWRPLLDRGLFPAVTERTAPEVSQPPPPADTLASEATERPVSPTRQEGEPTLPASSPINTERPDQEMRDGEFNGIVPVAELLSLEPATNIIIPSPVVPNEDPATISPTVVANGDTAPSNDEAMAVDAPEAPATIEPRPPTPLAVPERLPSPPSSMPEPTLDALPVEVELRQDDPATPAPPAPVSDPVTAPADPQVVIVATEEDNQSSEDGSTHSHDNDEEPPSSPPVPTSPPGPQLHRICRTCAAQVFFWGARGWWIKERAKAAESGELNETVRKRKDCENLGTCEQEFDNTHAREFNHIPQPLIPPSASGNTATSTSAVEPTTTEATPPPPTDSENSSQTTVNDSRPERPSRSPSPERVRMEVDPPVREPAPIDTTMEASTSTENSNAVDHEMSVPHTLPELIAQSPNVSQASGSSIDPPLADPVPSTSTLGEDYSEKIEPANLRDEDIRMATHEGSEAPIPVVATTTTTATRAT